MNQVDNLIEDLSTRFSSIKNFNLLQETEEGKKVFDLMVKSSSELQSFKTLFLNYYIPAASKSSAETWSQVVQSKYKHLLNLTKSDLKENIYETIRLGYVGLFHKYEAHLKTLVLATNIILEELREEYDLLTVEEYCKKEYNINIFKSHNNFYITKKISWICNCIKHYDGYPVKEPIHPMFTTADKNRRIEIEKELFKRDIELLVIHCETLLAQLYAMGFKQVLDVEFARLSKSIKSEIKEDLETQRQILIAKEKFEAILSPFRND